MFKNKEEIMYDIMNQIQNLKKYNIKPTYLNVSYDVMYQIQTLFVEYNPTLSGIWKLYGLTVSLVETDEYILEVSGTLQK